MPFQDNIIVIVDGQILDGQEILRKIKAKYGQYPIISETTKQTIADYEKRKRTRNISIKST